MLQPPPAGLLEADSPPVLPDEHDTGIRRAFHQQGTQDPQASPETQLDPHARCNTEGFLRLDDEITVQQDLSFGKSCTVPDQWIIRRVASISGQDFQGHPRRVKRLRVEVA
jgi:hypothetical protein